RDDTMGTAADCPTTECVAYCVWLAVPQPTERQHIGNQIKVLKAQYRDKADAVYSNLLCTAIAGHSKVTTLLRYSALQRPTEDSPFSEAPCNSRAFLMAVHIQTEERKNHESADSIQKNTNSGTSHRTDDGETCPRACREPRVA